MRKRQYIAALACLVAGAIGFVGVYSTEKAQDRKEKQQMAQETQMESEEDTEKSFEASKELEPKEKGTKQPAVTVEPDKEQPEEVKPTAAPDTLHFSAQDGLKWPVDGDVIMNYSMDSTVYFPTLEQYQYNPAIIIRGNVNDKVYLAAKGKISDISTNEVTGLTVTEELGDGYSAVYGQLKELNFAVGDKVEAGQVIGYVNEPTKYYSVEGSNVYFELLKDGAPVDPFTFLE